MKHGLMKKMKRTGQTRNEIEAHRMHQQARDQ